MKVHLWVFANLLPVQDYWEILLESRLNCSHFIERTLEIAKLSRPSLCATELDKNPLRRRKFCLKDLVFLYISGKKFSVATNLVRKHRICHCTIFSSWATFLNEIKHLRRSKSDLSTEEIRFVSAEIRCAANIRRGKYLGIRELQRRVKIWVSAASPSMHLLSMMIFAPISLLFRFSDNEFCSRTVGTIQIGYFLKKKDHKWIQLSVLSFELRKYPTSWNCPIFGSFWASIGVPSANKYWEISVKRIHLKVVFYQ